MLKRHNRNRSLVKEFLVVNITVLRTRGILRSRQFQMIQLIQTASLLFIISPYKFLIPRKFGNPIYKQIF